MKQSHLIICITDYCISLANCTFLTCRAESQGQVFTIIVSWLYQFLVILPSEEWKKIFLAYDNMCNLDQMKACQNELPLPAPYNVMWFEINKIIDGLHLQNHKGKDCHTKYNPERITDMHPELADTKNTMAAEQTFAWLG